VKTAIYFRYACGGFSPFFSTVTIATVIRNINDIRTMVFILLSRTIVSRCIRVICGGSVSGPYNTPLILLQ
jgi:hypothetical protein